MASKDLATFVPKATEPITLDKTTIFLYPKISPDMEDAEKQYGLLVNKSALENAVIPIRTKLSALGQHTDTSTIVSIMQQRVTAFTHQTIMEKGNFRVVSYHKANGVVIQNCLQSGTDKLKPYANASSSNRRPAHIVYAKLSCDISFTPIDPSNTSIHPFTFFVRLNTETRIVKNDQNADVTLTTFFGPDDWATSNDQSVINSVLKNPKALHKPFDIEAPSITTDKQADAIINTDSCVRRLENLALSACWNEITKRVFDQVCPNIQNDPVSVIQECHQSGTDSKGNKFELTVEEYFKAKNRLLDFLPKIGQWPLDVVQDFITHLKPEIREDLNSPKSTFRYNAMTASKEAHDQMMNLQLAYSAALAIEKTLGNMRQIAQNEMQSNHAFMANFSLADKAMRDNGKKLERVCWGCKSPNHAYAQGGKVVCPRASEPDIAAEAEKCRKEYNDRRKARRNRSEKSMKTQMLKIFNTEFKEFLKDAPDSPSKKAKTDFKNLCLMMLLCLNSKVNAKPVLPINYNINLPHFALPIGNKEIFSFGISVAFDTLAVLNVGNADFHLALSKRYPQVVKSLVWANDAYSPLTLSGVVGKDDNYKPTTLLPAVIEYYLSHNTKQDTSASFKVALGKNVAVNTIIGFATIKAAKLNLDVENDVITSSVLSTGPMPVVYKPVQCTPYPDFSGFPEKMTNMQASIPHVSAHAIVDCYNTITDIEKEPPKHTKSDSTDTSSDAEKSADTGKPFDHSALPITDSTT